MPKYTTNPKSRNQIQYDSDAKRGMKTKGFKLHIDDIAMIEQTAKRLGIPQNELIVRAVLAFDRHDG
ncbi:hypothetical protein LU293_09540 [Moraxella nasovis]|uniref:hypothetical protein n=1 Tax=Moraxella nasovis TaxID=2904121 RepID=UPI001F614C93|nr:hypothetical protein [Moraxella nasovis]UNU73292.1 hypothetical protein LU293_09540 [Moraxella nasovis]